MRHGLRVLTVRRHSAVVHSVIAPEEYASGKYAGMRETKKGNKQQEKVLCICCGQTRHSSRVTNLLHSGVIGVFTGFTRTLSRFFCC